MTAAQDQLRLDLAASRRDGLAVGIARAAIDGQPLTMVDAFRDADRKYNALADEGLQGEQPEAGCSVSDYQPKHRRNAECQDETGLCEWCEEFTAEMNAVRGYSTPKPRADDQAVSA